MAKTTYLTIRLDLPEGLIQDTPETLHKILASFADRYGSRQKIEQYAGGSPIPISYAGISIGTAEYQTDETVLKEIHYDSLLADLEDVLEKRGFDPIESEEILSHIRSNFPHTQPQSALILETAISRFPYTNLPNTGIAINFLNKWDREIELDVNHDNDRSRDLREYERRRDEEQRKGW